MYYSTSNNASAAPDLSLHISPPTSSTADSASSDLSQENVIFHTNQAAKPEPTLWLGLDSQRQHRHCHQHHRPPMHGGRDFKRSSTRKNVRAPRMRWTSTLHAHFVHAVELLGGHERMSFSNILFYHALNLFIYLFFWCIMLQEQLLNRYWS